MVAVDCVLALISELGCNNSPKHLGQNGEIADRATIVINVHGPSYCNAPSVLAGKRTSFIKKNSVMEG